MRILMEATIPHEAFNAAVRDGSAGSKLQQIIQDAKPEAVYFMARDGKRSTTMIIEMEDASQIPAYAEPWFLTFNANVEFHVIMSPEDLANAGLEALGEKWG